MDKLHVVVKLLRSNTVEDTRGRRGSTLDETENNNWKRKEKSTKKGRMGGGSITEQLDRMQCRRPWPGNAKNLSKPSTRTRRHR